MLEEFLPKTILPYRKFTLFKSFEASIQPKEHLLVAFPPSGGGEGKELCLLTPHLGGITLPSLCCRGESGEWYSLGSVLAFLHLEASKRFTL